ncbi:MAG TPA: TrkA C-terminal domain-containing protein, partial [Burkholderiales bacterium]|nr:TrkA C-terminal domain-containing protein [Burkholderiales bacterium]
MKPIFDWFAANPYILLFFVVGGAVAVGKVTIKGYGLGMVAAAIVVGAGLSAWASTYGVKMGLDNFAKSLFYYLFMYGVGLRVGPSFINSLKGDGLKFTILAVLCSVLGLLGAVYLSKAFDLPDGAAGGILAGSMTMSAAIGSAEEAVKQGVFKLDPGQTAEQVSGMIALSYGLTYIWGTVGIILICKYLPRWWGVDAKAAAKKYEQEKGVPNVDDAGLTGYRPLSLRAYRLTNNETAGQTVRQFLNKNPEYKIVNVGRGDERLGAPDDLVLQKGDVIALGGRLESMTANMGLIGPEVPDSKVLNIPIDQAEILVTNKEMVGKELKELRNTPLAGQVALHHIERGGVTIPMGLNTTLERFDVLFVGGAKSSIDKAGEILGKIARPSTSTDLLTLALGMILGFLIGAISFPLAGSKVGLGNAGGLLVSGIIVSSIA